MGRHYDDVPNVDIVDVTPEPIGEVTPSRRRKPRTIAVTVAAVGAALTLAVAATGLIADRHRTISDQTPSPAPRPTPPLWPDNCPTGAYCPNFTFEPATACDGLPTGGATFSVTIDAKTGQVLCIVSHK